MTLCFSKTTRKGKRGLNTNIDLSSITDENGNIDFNSEQIVEKIFGLFAASYSKQLNRPNYRHTQYCHQRNQPVNQKECNSCDAFVTCMLSSYETVHLLTKQILHNTKGILDSVPEALIKQEEVSSKQELIEATEIACSHCSQRLTDILALIQPFEK